MNNIQPWCISRQLWWGHRIPAWYSKDKKIFVAENEDEANKIAKKYYKKDVELRRDDDVLDQLFGKKLVFFFLTTCMAFLDKNFASANHCSVNKGSIIEFERSPKGTEFFIFSIFSNKLFSLSILTIKFLASKRSNPINSFGAV